MSNTSARPVLPSLQSLAFPSSDRTRANAGSMHDAGNVEFSKLLQKALGAPDTARDSEDTPPERESISIETLSIAQGFTALDRPLANDSMPSDAAIAPQALGEGSRTGDDANRSCGGRSGEHRGDGDPSTSPTEPMMSSAAPPSSAQPSTSGAPGPTTPSESAANELQSNTVPNTARAPSPTPVLPAPPATAPGQPLTSEAVATVEQSSATQVPRSDFAAVLATAAAEAAPATSSAQHAVTPSPTTVPIVPTPAATAAAAAATKTVDPSNPAIPTPNAGTPTVAPSQLDLASSATEAAKSATTAVAAAAAQNSTPATTPATTIVAGTTPAITPPIAAKTSSTVIRAAGTDATITATVDMTLATTGGPRAPLATDAAEPSPRGTAHPPATLTAQLSQDPSPVPLATPPGPSTPNQQPTPIPSNAAPTVDALDAPLVIAEGIETSAPGTEPTGREAMIAANASPVSTEQTIARAQRAAMHPAVAQVAVSVTKAVQEGVDRITIKLQPPELGRIDVRIDVGVDGRIQAVFSAERPATMEILQRDVRELERALQNAGLSADSGSLSFGPKQQGGGRYTPFAGAMGGDASAGDIAITGDVLVARNAAARRADGHLDIHV